MLPLKNKHFIFTPIPKHNKLRQLLQKISICLPLVPTTSYPKYIYLSVVPTMHILSHIYSFVCPWFQLHLIRNIFIYLPLVPTIYILSQISSFVCHWFQPYLIPLSAPLTKEVGYQGAVQPVPGEEPVFARVRMISPVEMDYAFVFAAWRDKDDHIKMDQWKR